MCGWQSECTLHSDRSRCSAASFRGLRVVSQSARAPWACARQIRQSPRYPLSPAAVPDPVITDDGCCRLQHRIEDRAIVHHRRYAVKEDAIDYKSILQGNAVTMPFNCRDDLGAEFGTLTAGCAFQPHRVRNLVAGSSAFDLAEGNYAGGQRGNLAADNALQPRDQRCREGWGPWLGGDARRAPTCR